MSINLNDKTSNGNNLTIHGSPVGTANTGFADSKQAAVINKATPDYFTAADSASLDITSNLTIEAWVKLSTISVRQEFVNKYGTSPNKGYQFTIDATNTWGIRLSDDGTGDNAVSSTGTLTANTWTHIAVAYTASSGQCVFYKNGSPDGTQTNTKTSIHANNELLYVGAENGGANGVDGVIDEVRVWNVTRNATEIANNYNIHLAGTESGLVAYYQFEPQSGGFLDTTSKFW